MNNGNRIRLEDEGEYGKGGYGDLYIFILVKPSKIFKREGDDLYLEKEISNYLHALWRMNYFRMKLHAKDFSFGILHSTDWRITTAGNRCESIRHLSYTVAVAHPYRREV